MKSNTKSNVNTYRLLFHFSVTLVILFPWPWFFRADEFKDLNNFSEFLNFWIIFTLITIPFYFTNSYLLVTFFLKRRKYLLYITMLLVCIFLSILLKEVLQISFFFPTENTLAELLQKPFHVFPMLMIFAIGTSFEMILSWEKQRRKEEETEKEKIRAELSFLKTQINPHFLFNSLNNIYSLSEKKSDRAGEAILLLSDILRYVLYETNHGKIQLRKEIQHLENYISMQRVRISAMEGLTIEFKYHGDVGNILIEPLLLIPFVENAFKHGISYEGPSKILIELFVTDNVFTFAVMNSKKKNQDLITKSNRDREGIGIANTKRRLDLMYRNRHVLSIKDSPDQYNVKLAIQLVEKEDWQNYAPLKVISAVN